MTQRTSVKLKETSFFQKSIICFFTIFFLTGFIKTSEAHEIYKVTASILQVRKEPSIKSNVVGKLPKDFIFSGSYLDDGKDNNDIVNEIKGRWVYVYYFNGYVFDGYLQKVTDQVDEKEYEYPPYKCLDDESGNFICRDSHQNNSNNDFEIQIKKVKIFYHYISYCRSEMKKDTLIPYSKYSQINMNNDGRFPKWIIFYDLKTNEPVQITIEENPIECDQ